MAVDLLLDPASDLVDGLGAELDFVEGVRLCSGVLELVIDGVLVAVERVQRRDLDTVAELLATLLELDPDTPRAPARISERIWSAGWRRPFVACPP